MSVSFTSIASRLARYTTPTTTANYGAVVESGSKDDVNKLFKLLYMSEIKSNKNLFDAETDDSMYYAKCLHKYYMGTLTLDEYDDLIVEVKDYNATISKSDDYILDSARVYEIVARYLYNTAVADGYNGTETVANITAVLEDGNNNTYFNSDFSDFINETYDVEKNIQTILNNSSYIVYNYTSVENAEETTRYYHASLTELASNEFEMVVDAIYLINIDSETYDSASSTYNITYKDVVSDSELQFVKAGYQLQCFYLNGNVAGTSGTTQANEPASISTHDTNIIIYKELNPYLRYVMDSDAIDIFTAYFLMTSSTNTSPLFSKISTSDISSFNSAYIPSTLISEAIGLSGMTINSILGNTYNSRHANNGEIIRYYDDGTVYDDYEVEEMMTLHHECRDFFYRAIRNDSFVTSEYYDVMENLLISWMTIERYLTARVENLKEIDSFTQTEIDNFLDSYGLSAIKTNDVFYNKTDYQKTIIANYNKLMQLKGSRDVITFLNTMFDSTFKDANIYRYILVRKTNGAADSLVFVKISDDSTTPMLDVKEALENGEYIDYETMIADDEYWSSTTVPEADMLEIDTLNYEDSKYMDVELIEDISAMFAQVRYLMGAVNFIEDKIDAASESLSTTAIVFDELSFLNDTSITNVTLKDAFAIVCMLFQKITNVTKESAATDDKYYGINTNIFELGDDETFIYKYKSFIVDFEHALGNTLYTVDDIDVTNEFWFMPVDISKTGTTYTTIYVPHIYQYRYSATATEEITVINNSLYVKLYDKNGDNENYASTNFLNSYARKLIFGEYFSESIVSNDSVDNAVINALLSINPIINQMFDDSDINKYTTFICSYLYPRYFEKTEQTGYDFNSDRADYYSYLIHPLVDFPTKMARGLMFCETYADDIISRNLQLQDVFNLIIDTFFYTDSDVIYSPKYTSAEDNDDKSFLEGVDDDIQDADTEDCNTVMVEMILSIQSLFSTSEYMEFYLTTSLDGQVELDFITEAIKIFKAYTSEIRDTSYSMRYAANSEGLIIVDSLKRNTIQYTTDTMFYDETLRLMRPYLWDKFHCNDSVSIVSV